MNWIAFSRRWTYVPEWVDQLVIEMTKRSVGAILKWLDRSGNRRPFETWDGRVRIGHVYDYKQAGKVTRIRIVSDDSDEERWSYVLQQLIPSTRMKQKYELLRGLQRYREVGMFHTQGALMPNVTHENQPLDWQGWSEEADYGDSVKQDEETQVEGQDGQVASDPAPS